MTFSEFFIILISNYLQPQDCQELKGIYGEKILLKCTILSYFRSMRMKNHPLMEVSLYTCISLLQNRGFILGIKFKTKFLII